MRAWLLPLLSISLACGGTARRPDGGEGILRVGVLAPDVRGEDQTGAIRRLSAERGHPIVLYFYPKDGTPGCTREACAFRDAWDRFEAAGVRVWGISADSLESHVQFAREHQLTFPLLSDPELRWARAFGVGSTLGMAHRVSFLIDRAGRVAKVYPDVDPAVHVDQVLADVAALARLPAQQSPVAPVPASPGPDAATLRLAWPLKICSIATSGVPSAVRAEGCNCGEQVSCEVSVREGAAVLVTRDDLRTTTACTACILSTARCAISQPLTPQRATIRVNDSIAVPVETTAAGSLIENRCWDVPRPTLDPAALEALERRLAPAPSP